MPHVGAYALDETGPHEISLNMFEDSDFRPSLTLRQKEKAHSQKEHFYIPMAELV